MKRVLFAIAFAALAALPAAAAGRVALVIGNANYANLNVLKNAATDATALAARLAGLGFAVTTVTDADRAAMRAAVAPFAEGAKGAEIALFFYGGHGVQIDGENLLIPVDASIGSADDLDDATLPLADFLSAATGAQAAIVLIDTSRNNPFDDVGRRRVERPQDQVAGSLFVLFSTAPGKHALDGADNSPFVAALLEHLGAPGDDISLTARKVMAGVMERTGGDQTPFYLSTLAGELVLGR